MPQPFITNSLKRKIDNFSKKPDISKYLNRNYRIKKMVHWEEPEGSGREGGGSGDRDGEHM